MSDLYSVRSAAAVLHRAAHGYALTTLRDEINAAGSIVGIIYAAGLGDDAKAELTDVVRDYILNMLEGATTPGTESMQVDIKATLEDHARDYVTNEVLGPEA